jgi:hypothetical protein
LAFFGLVEDDGMEELKSNNDEIDFEKKFFLLTLSKNSQWLDFHNVF